MVKVLQVLTTLNVCGGIENFVMNYYRAIDRSKVQFDFLIHKLNLHGDNFKAEAEALGAAVYQTPPFTVRNLPSVFQTLDSFYRQNSDYDIVHCHIANGAAFHFFYAPKTAVKILHSHQPAAADKRFNAARDFLLLKAADKMADVRWAGSLASGEFLFSRRPFAVINDAIDAPKFQGAKKYGAEIRRELNADGRYIIGHIGRLAPVKNHKFLLAIVDKLRRTIPNVLLCLIGEGELRDNLLSEINTRGLAENVRLLAPCRDVYKYYGAFDIFLLPSLFEGFGLVAVEAQYAGVPVLASQDRVPPEAKISELLEYLPLERGADAWAEKISAMRNKRIDSTVYSDKYDIRVQGKALEQRYLELSQKNESKGSAPDQRHNPLLQSIGGHR